MGAAAFWISLAAFLIAGMYFRSRNEAAKHETLRRIVEKTGHVSSNRSSTRRRPTPSPASPLLAAATARYAFSA